jgi:hypothetical protein
MSNATRFAYVVHQFVNGVSFYLSGEQMTERLELADIFNTMEEADLACEGDNVQAIRVSLSLSLSPVSSPETAQKPEAKTEERATLRNGAISFLALPASPSNVPATFSALRESIKANKQARRAARERDRKILERVKSGEKIHLLNGSRTVDIVAWESDALPFRSVSALPSGVEWNVWDIEIHFDMLVSTCYERTN